MRLAETVAVDLATAIESVRLFRHARAAAVAEERKRLVRDLHDAATRTMGAATLVAEALPQDGLWSVWDAAKGGNRLGQAHMVFRWLLVHDAGHTECR